MAMLNRVSTNPPGNLAATSMVVLSSVGFGLVPLFAKSLMHTGIASTAVIWYRFAISAVVLLPFVALSYPKRPATAMALGSGLAMGLGSIGYIEAITLAPVSSVAVIYMSYPLFTLVFAWLLLGQRPSGRTVTAGIMVLVAAFIALSPATVGPEALAGLLLSFTAPVSFGWAVVIMTGKLQALTPVERQAATSLGGLVGLLPLIVMLDRHTLLPERIDQWTWVAGLTLVTALLPQFMYVYAAPRIGPARAAMAGSFELPTMFLVGWLAFGEIIAALQMLAGLLVLVALLITPAVTLASAGPNTAGRAIVSDDG